MTPQEQLVAVISGSKSVISDGQTRLLACDIWLQGQLQRDRIGRSLVVACIDNTLDGIAIYLNLVFGSAIPVFFPKDTKPELLSRFMGDFRPAFLIAPLEGEHAPLGFSLQFSWGAFGVFAAAERYPYEMRDDLCLLATTSGSTGSPKVVRQTYANLLANSQQIVAALGLDAQSKAITALPISYTYGMSVVNCQVFCDGGLVVSDLAPTQKGFLELLEQEGVTVFPGVPQTYAQLNTMRFFKSRYAAGLQTYLQAGGKLPQPLEDDLVAKVATAGKQVYVMYGQAEATTRMSILPACEFGHLKGSAGPAVEGGRFSVIGADGTLLGAHQEGEILFQGPNVSLGYASSFEDLNASDAFEGLLKTGDVGYLDERGNLFITGRLKRFAKIKGHSVNLNHLEEILQKALQVEVICLERNETICVFHKAALEVACFEAVIQRDTNLKVRDFSLHPVADFPTTSSGKVNYSELAAALAE